MTKAEDEVVARKAISEESFDILCRGIFSDFLEDPFDEFETILICFAVARTSKSAESGCDGLVEVGKT